MRLKDVTRVEIQLHEVESSHYYEFRHEAMRREDSPLVEAEDSPIETMSVQDC